jgi:hypothetical protein
MTVVLGSADRKQEKPVEKNPEEKKSASKRRKTTK